MRVELILEAVDRASGVVEKVRGAVEKINTSMAQVATSEKLTQAHSRAVEALAASRAGMLDAAAAAFALNKSLKPAIDFEASIARLGAISEATADDLQRLSKAALDLGAKTSFTAKQTAEAMTALAAAGMKTEQVLKAIPAVLTLSEADAKKLPLERYAEIVSEATAQFRIGADGAQRAVDVLTKASLESTSAIGDIAYTMKYAGSAAATTNTSLEKTAAIVAQLSNLGIKGTSAGTALRSLFTRFADPPKAAAEALEELKVSTKDAAGNLRPIIDILNDIEKATRNLPTGDRLGALKAIAGAEALGGLEAALEGINSGALPQLIEKMEQAAGSAAKIGKVISNTTAGKLEQMKGAIETAAIVLGTLLLPQISETAMQVAAVAEKVTAWAQANPELARTLALALKYALMSVVAFKVLGFVFNGLCVGLIAIIGLFWKFNAAGRNVALLAVLFRGLAFAVRLALSPLSMVARFLFEVGAGFMAAAAAAGGWKVILAALGARALALATGGLVALKGAIMGIGAALLANPLGIMAMGIAAVAAGAYLVYRNWATIGPMLAKLWADMKAAAEAGWNALVETAGSLGTRLGTALKAAWDGAAGWVSAGVQAAIQTIKDLLDPVVKWIDEWGEKLSNVFKKVFGGIGDLVSGAIDRISAGLGKVGDLLSDASDWAFGPRTPKIIDPEKIQKSIDKAREYEAAIKAIAPAAQQALAQANAVLAAADCTSHGVRMMTTLAAGIRQGSQAAVAAVRETVQKIRDHLPHSPAKTGPLSDLDRVRFFETVAGAVKRGAPAAVDAVRAGTNQMAAALGGGGGGGLAGAAGGAAGGAVTINLTYNPSISATGGEGDVVEQVRKSAYEITEIIKAELGKRKRLEY